MALAFSLGKEIKENDSEFLKQGLIKVPVLVDACALLLRWDRLHLRSPSAINYKILASGTWNLSD